MSEEVIVNSEQVKEADRAENGAAQDRAETYSVDDLYVKKNGRYGSPKSQPETDWVEETYKCFIKDAGDIDPTDPVKAVEAYFQKNATDELKARCKAEGKDAKGCWKFIEAVARKALGGQSGHIDPGVVFAIAMHWFEDVPKDWDSASAKATARQAKPKKQQADNSKAAKPKTPAETPAEIKKAKAKAKKPKNRQGFFFEMLETPENGGENAAAQDTAKESEVQG